MFKLIKMPGSRINVPEPEKLTLSTPLSANAGAPIAVTGGVATLLSDTTTALPTHILLRKANDEKEVLAFRVTPGMIFEVPASAAPTGMTTGTEYLLSPDGGQVSATAASSSKRGAVLINKSGALAAGDSLLVSFPAV